VTSRDRLLAILRGQPRDRVAWTTLVDGASRSQMSARLRNMPAIDFYRHIRCDTLQWGLGGLVDPQVVDPVCRLVRPEMDQVDERRPDGALATQLRTQWGKLTWASRNGHPVEYAVKTADDLRVLQSIWAHSWYEEAPEDTDPYAPAFAAVGQSGILAEVVAPSPVQQLIETDMGLAGFYYHLSDRPREVHKLLQTMHARRLTEYEILARRSRADVIIPIENTSSRLTSPAIYERYSLPQISDYVGMIHNCGKLAVLHMCGHLHDLLPVLRKTGLDGVNGLTPPPVGDTPFEYALDVMGEQFLILGGVFPPNVFHATDLSYGRLAAALEELFTARVRRARLLLWIAVDGLPTRIDKFRMVDNWVRDNGAL